MQYFYKKNYKPFKKKLKILILKRNLINWKIKYRILNKTYIKRKKKR